MSERSWNFSEIGPVIRVLQDVAIDYTDSARDRKVGNFLNFSKKFFDGSGPLARCSCGEQRVCYGVDVVAGVVDCFILKNSTSTHSFLECHKQSDCSEFDLQCTKIRSKRFCCKHPGNFSNSSLLQAFRCSKTTENNSKNNHKSDY
jgi:hypothetical protein